MRWRDRARVTLAVALPLTLSIGATAAADPRAVVRHGACTGNSRWTLSLREVRGDELRVRLDVRGGAAGHGWHVFLSDNGTGFYAGTRTASPDGRFHVTDRAGAAATVDRIRAAMNNVITGEICAGRAAL
jgi:hypothetical protein